MKTLRDTLRPVIERIAAGERNVACNELWGAAKALFLAGLGRETRRPLLVVTATEELADTVVADLRFFATRPGLFADPSGTEGNTAPVPPAFLFPAWGVLPFEADSPDSATIGARMSVLYQLLSGGPAIYVAPIRSLIQKLPPWSLFAESVVTITRATRTGPEALAAALVAAGYESASLVTRVGEYSRRGGIVDFFSPHYKQPMRIEFFGDEIDSLRSFDPATQRSTGDLQEAVALPVRELLIDETGLERLRGKSPVLWEQIQDAGPQPGSEFLAPFFYAMESLFDYLPKDGLIALLEPEDLYHEIGTWQERIEQGRDEEAAEGRKLPASDELYLHAEDLRAATLRFGSLDLRLLGAGSGIGMDTRSASWLGLRLTRPLANNEEQHGAEEGSLAGLIEKLRRLRETSRVAIFCADHESAERVRALFLENGLGTALGPLAPAAGASPWPIMLDLGRISEGFAWPDLGLALVTEEEIFGRKAHRVSGGKRLTRASPFLSTFKELKPGDFVVHTDYGVGEYQGLSRIAVDGFATDFLCLRYEPDAKLYVPLYSLDKVQKYLGVETGAPRLDRLGSPVWARTKEKVKKDLLAMAQELVTISAAREARSRQAFTPPDTLYREFEAAFPFDETPDQQKAIEEVLADLERPRPMDRLVCGDVGYGKTEVALRAAFKVVEDGLQVAVLVPTTLLADQHFRTFRARCAQFSARVEMLSRFRSAAEQRETLKGLKSGTVDIVIGTHRLLQRDVAFRNLGLLVVDEEHKFGVRHKERIKEFKKLVDVLTLTATPIPRTLHLSLSGIRDLSVIQTPPLDRRAIQVVLARFGKRVIREAIEQELARGGQVFFVLNGVQSIDRMAEFVRGLVPAAVVGVAHGQMGEEEIEEAMSRFIAGSSDVLVTTTIIESGIDIPRANTIIINRADRFGLADLYQIKGRVGRSTEKAFAYLLVPADETLSDTARKRLRAIQELSELGAGFQIALQDLETRGAGNLLGKQQSGHIAAVGIDLYTSMLEDAVAELRGAELVQETDTQISFRASAFIPEDYIADMSLRLAAYKEISAVGNEADLKETGEALRDRYGPLPEPAANLIAIMGVKLLARRAQVERIDAGASAATITFAENAPVSPDRVLVLLKKSKGMITLVPERGLRLALPDETLKTAVNTVKKCLQELM